MATILNGLLPLLFAFPTSALLGYDCGAANTRITQISLKEIGNCDIAMPNVTKTRVDIQLLQIVDYDTTHARMCKVDVHRTITRCLWLSRSAAVKGGVASYVMELSKEKCDILHESGRITIGDTLINGIKGNSSTLRTVTMAGSLKEDGDCDGVKYSDEFGSWEDVVVSASVKITLLDQEIAVDIKDNVVVLPEGQRCQLHIGRCTDFNGFQVFWNSLPQDTCKFNRYGLLYQGLADKLVDNTGKYTEIVYSVMTEDITFALTADRSQPLCGYILTKTEHPKLFILEGKSEFFKTSH